MATREAGPGFLSLTINDWRQFDRITIEFHPRLTILTGENASGKSTILVMLARHFNWSRTFSSAPIRSRGQRTLLRWSSLGRRRSRGNKALEEGWHEVGRLAYTDGHETTIAALQSSPEVRSQYDVNFQEPHAVPGVFLTSHRAVAGNYVQLSSIPTLFGTPDQLFEQFTNELRTRWLGSWTGKTPQLALKESLIAAAVFGEGNEAVDPNPDAAAIWRGFQAVLGGILPPSLGFRRLRVRVPDIIVETRTGDFILDEASGGMSSLVEMAWQIFLRSRNLSAFTVLLDEPENHLHPRLQREVLPALLRAFPSVQFVVATHSPFVVTADPDSAVYVLDYNEQGRVDSRQLDYVNKAASADDTLRRVLGLESTMPAWAEDRFERILNEHLGAEMTPDALTTLRDALRRDGLETQFPDAMVAASERDVDWRPPPA